MLPLDGATALLSPNGDQDDADRVYFAAEGAGRDLSKAPTPHVLAVARGGSEWLVCFESAAELQAWLQAAHELRQKPPAPRPQEGEARAEDGAPRPPPRIPRRARAAQGHLPPRGLPLHRRGQASHRAAFIGQLLHGATVPDWLPRGLPRDAIIFQTNDADERTEGGEAAF